MTFPSRQRVLITGAGGCIGRYLVEELLEHSQHDLVLIVRRKNQVPLDDRARSRVTVIEADVRELRKFRDALDRADVAVLVAACWGGDETFAVNVDANLAIAETLATLPGRRVIYFSSASALDHQNRLLAAAKAFGTEYIRSKYQLVETIEDKATRIGVIGVFPTLVLGGDETYPASHFARLLRQAAPWASLMRFFRVEGRFHFIHAADIARVVHALIDQPMGANITPRRIVLGNPAMSIDEIIGQFTSYVGARAPFRVRLRDWMVGPVIWLFRIQLTAWDRHCMMHPDQSYQDAINPSALGLSVFCPDLRTGLRQIGLKPVRTH